MSQAAPVTAVNPPDPAIMKRLGYIRLLYNQAVAQSQAPAPLNFSALLAFHDVMEYFFLLAVAHVGGEQGINLKDKFVENARSAVNQTRGSPTCSSLAL
jgi:hypothetical protein